MQHYKRRRKIAEKDRKAREQVAVLQHYYVDLEELAIDSTLLNG
jgi:hypothetical protein